MQKKPIPALQVKAKGIKEKRATACTMSESEKNCDTSVEACHHPFNDEVRRGHLHFLMPKKVLGFSCVALGWFPRKWKYA